MQVFEVLQSLLHLHHACFPITSKYALQESLKLSVVFLFNDVYLIPIIIGLRYGLGFICSLP